MKKIITIASFLALIACQKEQKHQATVEKNVTPVRVTPVNLYQPKGATRYSASILPGRKVSLSFRVSGIVSNIYKIGGRGLEPGDFVAGGAVLGRLRAEDYTHNSSQAQSQLQAARETQKSAAAQLAQAQASRVKAEADFARAKALYESQSLTRPEFDSARAQLDVNNAQVEAARAQLDSAAAQIRNAEASVGTASLAQFDTALVAPFAATVVQRNIELGMLAGPSAVAYTLADIGTVKAAFGVPDTAVVEMRPGRVISVSVEALGGREFNGTVTSVASVADTETRLFQVEVTIVNQGMILKPGMIASLGLEDPAPGPAVPVVPLSAVVRDRAHPADFTVMVVEGNVAKSRRVGLGATFGELLAVSGVRPGEMVINAGGTLVTDGDSVEVLR
jgi:multidrug efflux system membrane fusion protein